MQDAQNWGINTKFPRASPGPRASLPQKAFICIANSASTFIYHHEHNATMAQMTGCMIL